MKMKKPTYSNWFDTRQKPDPSFTPGEQHIYVLELIWEFGLLADYQLMALLGIKKSWLHEIMGALWNNHYVNRPNPKVRAGYDYMFWVLSKKGARVVAERQNIEYRDLDWVRQPGRTQTHHDVLINDFRIIMELALRDHEEFEMEEWQSEAVFRSRQARVYYTTPGGKQGSRVFIPDGYIKVKRSVPGREKPFHARMFPEIELSAKSNPRFVLHKILPGLAYMQSDIYETYHGWRNGRFLFITFSREKIDNYIQVTEKAIDPKFYRYFYFAYFDDITVNSILFEPIWRVPGSKEPIGLFKQNDVVAT